MPPKDAAALGRRRLCWGDRHTLHAPAFCVSRVCGDQMTWYHLHYDLSFNSSISTAFYVVVEKNILIFLVLNASCSDSVESM